MKLPIVITSCIPILFQASAIAQPTINSLSTASGNPGASITITGTNFNAMAADNIVYFGATRATVSAATATSLHVTVPYGATYMPVSVNNTATSLMAYSENAFLPTYNNSSYDVNAVNFDAKIDSGTGYTPYLVELSDLDGDGKPDMVITNLGDNTISVYKNTTSGGAISFARAIIIPTGSSPFGIAVSDLDGDGKPDLVVVNQHSNSFSVFLNTTTTTGSISFATAATFNTSSGPQYIAIGDVDGDGKADIAITNNDVGTVSVFKNNSVPGSLSFAANVDFTTGPLPVSVAMADLDGDGKPELIVSSSSGSSVSIFHNTTTLGVINATSFVTGMTMFAGLGAFGVAVGDIDGDGKPDIAVAAQDDNNIAVYHNTSVLGTLSFSPAVYFVCDAQPVTIEMGDINGDGKPDMSVVCYGSSTVDVFRNTATTDTITASSFAPKVDFVTGVQPYGLAIGDLNGDAQPELIATDIGSNTVSILRNSPLPALNVSNFTGNEGGIFMYPNPATSELVISAKNPITDVSICNILGQMVFTQNYNANHVQIDVAGLPNAVYMVKAGGVEIGKFVKE